MGCGGVRYNSTELMKLLEVIVTSVEEACEAEDGGADRLELVQDLHSEGLTPSLDLVENVLAAVSIPVRVMLRATPSFYAGNDGDVVNLQKIAHAFSQLPIGGLVLGFLKDRDVDLCAIQQVLGVTGITPITFHRAIEHVADPFHTIDELKGFPQIDRILLNGGAGTWGERRRYLEDLQEHAAPEITLIVGGGLNEEALEALAPSPLLREFHTGRAARDESGCVRSRYVRKLSRILQTYSSGTSQ
jgi:copper homeostasis protein